MESMKGNKNAEKWTEELATKFFDDALELSTNPDYDFLGEIARDLGQYIDLFDDLMARFPQLKEVKKRIKDNCAANCYSNGKKGDIVPSMAIMNLKSNHGWTDRVDTTTKDKEINNNTVDISKLSDAALRELANASRDTK